MKTKRPYTQVKSVADYVVKKLRPACERIEIAGSLRRKKRYVGDIEIVAIPKRYRDIFGGPYGCLVTDLIDSWDVDITKNGEKYKQFSFCIGDDPNVYQVDLFLQPDPATWGVNYLIRTGSAEFSQRMVTPRSKGGYMPDQYRVSGARVWDGATKLSTLEEVDIFTLWGMDYLMPEQRV